MLKLFPLSLVLVGCAGSGLGAAEVPLAGDHGARVAEGTADAMGILALLNDPSTTYRSLDEDVRLDRRAAESLIAHRNGPDGELGWLHDDLFDSMNEVDEQYYVGPEALRTLHAYALAHDWVPTADDDVLGTWDEVQFTVGDARATVELANTAGPDFLDDTLGLDHRAVENILAARPIQTVQQLSNLPRVGHATLTTLLDAATGTPDCERPGWHTEYVYADGPWREQLPEGLVTRIDEALLVDDWCGDASGDPWFVKATIDRFACDPKGYTIELGQQTLDGGAPWTIEFEVTETFDAFLSACEI